MPTLLRWDAIFLYSIISINNIHFFVIQKKLLMASHEIKCSVLHILYCLYIAVASAVGERKESKGQMSDADSTLIWLSSVNLLRTTARIFQLMFFLLW